MFCPPLVCYGGSNGAINMTSIRYDNLWIGGAQWKRLHWYVALDKSMQAGGWYCALAHHSTVTPFCVCAPYPTDTDAFELLDVLDQPAGPFTDALFKIMGTFDAAVAELTTTPPPRPRVRRTLQLGICVITTQFNFSVGVTYLWRDCLLQMSTAVVKFPFPSLCMCAQPTVCTHKMTS